MADDNLTDGAQPAVEDTSAAIEEREDQEWAQAQEKLYGEEKDTPKEGADSPKKNEGEDKGGEPNTPTGDPVETEEEKAKREANEAAAKEQENQDPVENPTIREQRQIQREMAEDHKSMREDIKTAMFGDLKTELTDSDGDPIRTIEDVMALQNPNTGKQFTEQEAAIYLLNAQKWLDGEIAKAEEQIDKITEVNLTIKDEVSSVLGKYKTLFSENPGLQKEVFEAYKGTLVTDPETGIIIDAPVSLEKFYDVALGGHMKSVEQQTEAEKAKADAEAAKKAAQAKSDKLDRSDIFSGSKPETMDEDDQEWENSFSKYYGKK